jgi:serine/threonine protein kinase
MKPKNGSIWGCTRTSSPAIMCAILTASRTPLPSWLKGAAWTSWIREDHDLYEAVTNRLLARILDIAIQFAWGLGYAHEQGLVHQDVKPQNALMTPDGVLKVTDFGLAKAKGTTGATPEGGLGEDILVTGGGYTLAYRSPEQAQRKKLFKKRTCGVGRSQSWRCSMGD